MIYRLDPARYKTVRPLFHKLEEYQPMCSAVLDGVYPGKVFVDDLKHPETAFLSTFISGEDEGVWGFLAGEPRNDLFNNTLNKAISNREIISENTPIVFFSCHPEDWYGQLPIVLHPHQPIPVLRRHYECHDIESDRRSDIPEGYDIRRLDKTLQSLPGLRIPDDVSKILKKWRSIKEPGFLDFGFVCIHGDRIVSWATVDFVSGGVGEAGIFTLEGYRRRGLSTVVTAAAMEHGLSHGLSKIHWTCAETNIASIRTAEKLGFERGRDYTMYYLIFDEVQHLGNLAYSHLQNGRYREAVDIFEKNLVPRNDLPLWAYYDAARAWAGLGNQDKMFRYLNTLAERGWTEVEELENCKEFEPWRKTREWEALMERMRGDKNELDVS
ncbi:MAG TPA: GNAT family N-acetyltransferase [Anaerolineae bacterium]|nr:GNAT family N-acetyltransferase [Anaerolineae bacterium]